MCGLEPPAVGKGPGFLNVEVSLARTVPDRKGDSNPRQRSLCQEPPHPPELRESLGSILIAMPTGL